MTIDAPTTSRGHEVRMMTHGRKAIGGVERARARGRATRDVARRARRGILGEILTKDDTTKDDKGDRRGERENEGKEGQGKDAGCPCGRERAYDACCGRLHDGASTTEVTPEDVMRARFTAYVQKRCEYIVTSTHDDSKDMARNNLLADAEQTVARIRFLKFRVKRTTPASETDGDAYVTYEADFDKGAKKAKISRTKAKTLAERARLRKDAVTGEWKFVDAVALNSNTIDDDGSEDVGDSGFGSAAGRKNGSIHKIF